jgi:thiamine pyrophosphokinase
MPQTIMGDLDSLNQETGKYYASMGNLILSYKSNRLGAKLIRLPDQDSTDLEKCINYIPDSKVSLTIQLNVTYQSILILGGLGGNFTQALGNINTLYLFPHKKISLLSDENVTFLLQPGTHNIECTEGTKVGLIPIGNICSSVTTSGLKWDIGK